MNEAIKSKSDFGPEIAFLIEKARLFGLEETAKSLQKAFLTYGSEYGLMLISGKR